MEHPEFAINMKRREQRFLSRFGTLMQQHRCTQLPVCICQSWLPQAHKPVKEHINRNDFQRSNLMELSHIMRVVLTLTDDSEILDK